MGQNSQSHPLQIKKALKIQGFFYKYFFKIYFSFLSLAKSITTGEAINIDE